MLLVMLKRVRGKRLNPLSKRQWFAIISLSWIMTLVVMFDYGLKRGFKLGAKDGFESVAYHECEPVNSAVFAECVEGLIHRYQGQQSDPRWRLRNPAETPEPGF
jgi:hypothetical protein